MTDFSVYTAEQVVDWMSQGTVETPPSNLYITLFDSGGNEVDDDFPNMRLETEPADWDVVDTSFENNTNLDFGEAADDVNDIVDVALFDAETGGNEIARYPVEDTPKDIAAGTNAIYLIGELSFDVRDRTQ